MQPMQKKKIRLYAHFVFMLYPAVLSVFVFILSYFVIGQSLVISAFAAVITFMLLLHFAFAIARQERTTMIKMADILKRQNQRQADALSQSAVKELRKTIRTKEPVVLNHFVKRRLEQKLDEMGLLDSANHGDDYQVIYSVELEKATSEIASLNTTQQKIDESTSLDKEHDKKNDKDCDAKDKDAAGVCVKYETGREEIDSRAIQPEERKEERKEDDYLKPVETNPATGLPMLENGLDTMGNPRGFDFERERLDRIAEDEQRRIRELEAIEIQRREEIERLLQADRDRLEAERERENKRRFEEERTTWGGYDSRY